MKTSQVISRTLVVSALFLLLGVPIVNAQTNYKHPQINAKGELMDASGNKQGWITKEGIIMDAMGMKVAFVDGQGNLVDAKGKKMGRAGKNGNFSDINGSVLLTVGEPNGEYCDIKDPSGKVVGRVHRNYKQQGSCALQCLAKGMKM